MFSRFDTIPVCDGHTAYIYISIADARKKHKSWFHENDNSNNLQQRNHHQWILIITIIISSSSSSLSEQVIISNNEIPTATWNCYILPRITYLLTTLLNTAVCVCVCVWSYYSTLLTTAVCVCVWSHWNRQCESVVTIQYIGTNLIHREKHNISWWVFDNMSKFTDTEFEKFTEILWAFFSVIWM